MKFEELIQEITKVHFSEVDKWVNKFATSQNEIFKLQATIKDRDKEIFDYNEELADALTKELRLSELLSESKDCVLSQSHPKLIAPIEQALAPPKQNHKTTVQCSLPKDESVYKKEPGPLYGPKPNRDGGKLYDELVNPIEDDATFG